MLRCKFTPPSGDSFSKLYVVKGFKVVPDADKHGYIVGTYDGDGTVRWLKGGQFHTNWHSMLRYIMICRYILITHFNLMIVLVSSLYCN